VFVKYTPENHSFTAKIRFFTGHTKPYMQFLLCCENKDNNFKEALMTCSADLDTSGKSMGKF